MLLARLVALASLPLILVGCSGGGNALVAACEEELKERLRSPSEYVRVELTIADDEPMTADEWIAWNESTGTTADYDRRRIEDGAMQPMKHLAFIRYDAPNAYGTPIRGTAMCEYASRNGDMSNVSDLNVVVNGQTHIEWMIERLPR